MGENVVVNDDDMKLFCDNIHPNSLLTNLELWNQPNITDKSIEILFNTISKQIIQIETFDITKFKYNKSNI